MSDAGLAGILADDRVEVFVLYGDGAPAGYFELDRRGQAAVNRGTIDLAYFGLMPHGVGRGLGRYLLHAALEQRSEERRVGKEWVSTGRSRWSPAHNKKQKN